MPRYDYLLEITCLWIFTIELTRYVYPHVRIFRSMYYETLESKLELYITNQNMIVKVFISYILDINYTRC